jgi:hypothetical protein
MPGGFTGGRVASGGARPPPEIMRAYREALRAADADVPEVGLTEVEERGYSIEEQIALHHADLRQQDADLRKWMADRVVPAFLKANFLTLAALAVLVVLDEANIACHLIAPGDRIITEKVIMALLGATTVQVGAIAALIARYLFPGRPA